VSVPAEALRRIRDRASRIAVVGASNAAEKYGNIITLDLRGLGYTVLPVNPHERAIAGLTAYPSVDDAPGPVDIVDFVVPPRVTGEILQALDPARYPVIWLQPGSFDAPAEALARSRFPHVVAGDCIMVVARWK
jgi:predicted CoA-binding protein